MENTIEPYLLTWLGLAVPRGAVRDMIKRRAIPYIMNGRRYLIEIGFG